MKALVAAALLALAPVRLAAQSAYQMDLKIVNDTGLSDADVHVMALANGGTAYLSFTGTWSWVSLPAFSFDAATMTASLAAVRALNADHTATLHFPAIASARLYFSAGKGFDAVPLVNAAGPAFGPTNTVMCDKVEFALDGNDNNINTTAVDYFGISCQVTAKDRDSGTNATVGSTLSTEEVFDAFPRPAPSPASQHAGNTGIFRALIVRDANGRPVRAIAPKAAGYGDLNVVSDPDLPRKISHFFDDYVAQHCWKPNRLFAFHAKDAQTTSAPTYYGRVSADGLTLFIYTDAARTQPYAPVPSIPRPSNAWDHPTLPGSWHNDGTLSQSLDEIDWGFVLSGQAGPGDAHASFITYKLIHDPVAMAIPVSIARGVMHLDDGDKWMSLAEFDAHGDGSAALPTFWYGKVLRDTAIGRKAYALSFDDIYRTNPSIHFTDPAVTLTLNPLVAPRRLHALLPCRMLDTREAAHGPALGAGERRTVAAAGVCGVPDTARALVVNVTAVGSGADGHFTLFRGDGPLPSTSTVAFAAGKTRAGQAVAVLAADGTLTLLNGSAAAAHALIDVAGYFE